ncbi:MAG TPA: patatin-like phospholipase family protein [Draconibacterium sp.]|nr:patatin-like phospholipase family protein [Draconibacterium sp.]
MKGKFIEILLLTLVSFFVLPACNQSNSQSKQMLPPKGTAILITGAAARIPQEAALLEHLYKTGQLDSVVFIAGASSGALNTVMLNAILAKKITWEQYIGWLKKIRNNDIYISNGKELPVDIQPLRHFLTRIVNDSLGYYKMKDLPITSAISITDINMLGMHKKNYRLSNKKINMESDPNLNIVDVLMASTAFPIVFPEERIPSATTLPDHRFADGGIGDDHVPFSGLLDFIRYREQSVKKVIIVSRKSDSEPDVSEELKTLGITDKGFFDKLGISLDEILYKGFIKAMKAMQKKAPDLAKRTKVYIPNFSDNFLLLDFNDLEKQYDVTKKWAQKNNPVPMEMYLSENENSTLIDQIL